MDGNTAGGDVVEPMKTVAAPEDHDEE